MSTEQLLEFANLWLLMPDMVNFEENPLGISLTKDGQKTVVFAFHLNTGETYTTLQGDELVFTSVSPASAVRMMLTTLGIL